MLVLSGALASWWHLAPFQPGSVGGLEGILCYTEEV